jgi:RNA polymerase sigma-70 factor, ECF subfamily
VTETMSANESSHEVHATPKPSANRPAFELEELFRAHAGFIANTLRRFGVAPSDLQDQTQEVFLVVHDLRSVYDPQRPIRPWMFGIAYRVAGRYRQARGRGAATEDIADHDIEDAAPRPDAELEVKQAQQLVLEALEHVELSRRAVLILADIEGESAPTIADALQIPLNTAYSRLRIAREEFKNAVVRIRSRQQKGRT